MFSLERVTAPAHPGHAGASDTQTGLLSTQAGVKLPQTQYKIFLWLLCRIGDIP